MAPRCKKMTAPATALVLLALATVARAGDGVIEINQARALAGGITPADTAGFPVEINAPGSYILTSDLIVSGVDTIGIQALTSEVTLDLNGFRIVGPVTCTGAGATLSCSATGLGTGRRIADCAGRCGYPCPIGVSCGGLPGASTCPSPQASW